MESIETPNLEDGLAVFVDKLNTAADIITSKLIEQAPEALESILNIIQYKGIFDLATAFVLVCVFAPLSVFFAKVARDGLLDKYDTPLDSEFAGIVFGILFSLAIAGAIIFSGRIFDFNLWLASFYPEGALALKALNSVGIEL